MIKKINERIKLLVSCMSCNIQAVCFVFVLYILMHIVLMDRRTSGILFSLQCQIYTEPVLFYLPNSPS